MSRNVVQHRLVPVKTVTPRERRVSRNYITPECDRFDKVTPRERRVSRNSEEGEMVRNANGHASREACE